MNRSIVFFAVAYAWTLTGTLARGGELTEAEVTRVVNTVEIGEIHDGKAVLSKAKESDRLSINQVLKTGAKSRAEIQFNDKTLARIGQHTLFSFKKDSREVSLFRGSLLLDVPKGLGTTRISAAGVTAAVTGSTGFFQATDDFFALFVFDGTFTVGEFTLGPGQALIKQNGEFKVIQFDIQAFIESCGLFDDLDSLPNALLVRDNANNQQNLGLENLWVYQTSNNAKIFSNPPEPYVPPPPIDTTPEPEPYMIEEPY
jgi:hypothetical protein